MMGIASMEPIATVLIIVLVIAVIWDLRSSRIPNWLTFPAMSIALAGHAWLDGMDGVLFSMAGLGTGLGLFILVYLVGGMGAGDVKLLAGVGAWIGMGDTLYAFCVSAVVGGVIALLMVAYRRAWTKHYFQFLTIWYDMMTIRDPEQLSTIAAERKSTMLLLPYGIPIAIGTIAYFAFKGMLI